MLVSRRIALFIGSLFFVAAPCATVVAQPLLLGPATTKGENDKSPVVPGTPPASLTDVRAQNAEQLRLAQRKLEANGAADKVTAREVAYLRTRDAILAQRAAVEQPINDLNLRKARIESQIKQPQAPDKPPTFADLDKMKDDLSTAQAKAALLADKLDSAKSNKERAQSALDECQVKNRQAQAAFASGKDGAKAAE